MSGDEIYRLLTLLRLKHIAFYIDSHHFRLPLCNINAV